MARESFSYIDVALEAKGARVWPPAQYAVGNRQTASVTDQPSDRSLKLKFPLLQDETSRKAAYDPVCGLRLWR